jgi:hypothetical protein
VGAPAASAENTVLGPDMTEMGKACSVGNACPAEFNGIDRNRPGGAIGAPKFKFRPDNAKGGGEGM